MATSRSTQSPYHALLVLGSVLLVIAALHWAQSVLVPVAAALLFAFILTPAVVALQRRGLKRIYAVVIVVLLTFALVGAVGYVVVIQFLDLARSLPTHKDNILAKIQAVKGDEPGALSNLTDMLQSIIATLTKSSGAPDPVQDVVAVRVVSETTSLSWVPQFLGPILEPLASAGLVIILVLFMLVQREDLRDRLIKLVGHGRLSVTTRALDEAGQRISRYLLMLCVVNGSYGVALALGLMAGNLFTPVPLPYVFLWGFLAAILRFLPYIGPWIAALFPVTLSIAISPGWTQPLYVLGLFLAIELVSNNVVEPWLYGRNVGISEVALLVAAAFWTWLWGPVGLVLSTPLTACLIVLGKYVPSLEFFDVMLADKSALSPDASYYQRLLARDQDEAADLIEEHMQGNTAEAACDEVFVPALSRARRDRANEELAADDEAFLLHTTREILEDVVAPVQQMSFVARHGAEALEEPGDEPKPLVLGIPARDEADELTLEMFGLMLERTRCDFENLSAKMLAAEMVEQVRKRKPALICIASLPPGGLAHVRYLCKRLKAAGSVRIVVGRWGQMENVEKVRERLRQSGADQVATSLREARELVLPLLSVAAPAAEVKLQPAAG